MRILYFVIMLSGVNFMYSQNPGSVNDNLLWIRSNKNDTILQKSSTLQEIYNSCFNFNPVIDFDDLDDLVFKNIVSQKFSLFIVFKSDSDNNLPVVTINRGKQTVYLTNKELVGDNEVQYKEVDSKKGILLSYFSGTGANVGKKKNNLRLEDFYEGDEEGKQQLLEVIYYPRILNERDRVKVETYLSLKYGLSLLGNTSYVNSVNDTIWDAEKNVVYNNRVTGIARDDASALYQKQSGNAEKDGLYLGLGIIDTANAKNKNVIEDKTYILWGDNGGKVKFEKKANLSRNIERTWLLQQSKSVYEDSIVTQLGLKKDEFFSEDFVRSKGEFVWLAINKSIADEFDFIESDYFMQDRENDLYVFFDNLVWDRDNTGSDNFTFLTGPDFFFNYDVIIEDCEVPSSAVMKLKIAGGQPPFTVMLVSEKKNITNTANDLYYEYWNLDSGNYVITLIDGRGKKQEANFTINSIADLKISLAKEWYLNNEGEVTIIPQHSGISQQDVLFQWEKDGKILSKEDKLIVNESGDYYLVISNQYGCIKKIPFKVSQKSLDFTEWQMYPNPVKKGEPFNISFNLNKESKVSVRVNSIEGKQVSLTELGSVKEYIHKEILNTSGIYLITVTYGSTAETVKLIVE